MSYMVDKPPTEDKLLARQVRDWEPTIHRPVLTQSRGAFKTYSTYVSPAVQARSTHGEHLSGSASD